MTAWEEIQMDWAENTEKNNPSGILLWDLSAAFDTLDVDIFCEKIVFYVLLIIYKFPTFAAKTMRPIFHAFYPNSIQFIFLIYKSIRT